MAIIEKSVLRALLESDAPTDLDAPQPGRLAERLRREPAYRRARQVFASPAPILAQIRINILLDNKTLIMPSGALKEGFFRILPFTVPFPELSQAVTLRNLAQYGERLRGEELAGLGIDLMVTDALAVDNAGGLLGDGQGFFDLAAALLSVYGALAETVTILAVPGPGQMAAGQLALDPWDVHIDAAILAEEVVVFPGKRTGIPAINWAVLPLDLVRRIDPLWKLYEKQREKLDDHRADEQDS